MDRDRIINAAGNVFIAEAAINLLDQLNPENDASKDAVSKMKERLKKIRNDESLVADKA